MASILEWNTNYARENNLPIAATFEKLLAIPGGATLFDHQYHINNWEDLAEGLGEQLVDELQSKGQKQFLLDNARKITYAGVGPNDQDFKNFVQTLNTLPLTQAEADKVNIDVQQGVADLNQSQASVTEFKRNFKMPGGGFGNLVGDVGKVTKQLAANPVVQIGLAYYMPGIASSFAPSLGAFGITGAAQTAVANAIVSTAVQVAQGVPLDKALQTAVTNAVVSSGSPEIAKDINRVIQNPAVTDAIVSAGASAAKTALNGGSQADIERNLAAGLVGSGVATATGSSVAGSAAGGAVTGGVTGALTGAANQYVSELAAENLAKEKAAKIASGSSRDPGINVAGGDDATALKMASISAMPEMLGKSGETASAIYPVVEGGQTFYERTITGKTSDGKDYSYTVTYDPGASAGRQITYTTSGVSLDADGNVIPGGGGGAVATFKRPNYTDYKPTIITVSGTTPTPKPIPNPTPSPVPSPVPAPPERPPAPSPSVGSSDAGGDITGGTVTGGSTGGTSTNVGTGAGSSGTITDVRGGDGTVGTGTGSGSSGSGTRTGDGSGAGGGTGGTGTGTGGEGDGTGGEKELPPVEDKTGTPVDKPYRPNLFIYGGTKPSTLSRTLGTTVQNVPTASTTTGTSVGLGGRGEIESKESGKKRQTVWNEESLRLKDALGL